MKKSLLAVAPIALSLFISGCGSMGIGEASYSCSDYRDGVNCKSAREVYDMTEHSRTPQARHGHEAKKDTDQAQPKAQSSRASARRRGRAVEPEVVEQPTIQQVRPGRHFELDGPTPIRTPAQVMRIWIDSYEDKQGDLHVPGLVYTEIQERTWNLGQRAPDRAGQRVRSISGHSLEKPE